MRRRSCRLALSLVLLVAVVAPLTAAAVGTNVITEETFGSIRKIKCAWVSDAAGNVSGTLTLGAYNGAIERLVTVPSGGGTAPTTLYDITILDEDGTDVLMGAGADRSATVTEQVQRTSLGVVANDRLELRIANAGNAKQGTVYLYLR
jgi:hypothetical protein